MNSALMSVENLCKNFGAEEALKGVSFSLEAGDLTLLLGANGSGKTTLLRACAGLLKTDGGMVSFNGHKEFPSSRIGFAGHQPLLYAHLTVRENLEYIASLLDTKVDVCERIDQWMLAAKQDIQLRSLSKGEQARVGLCRTFLNDPHYCILDEPTASLDERSAQILFGVLSEILKGQGSKSFVLMSSHDIARVSGWVSRVMVIAAGKMIYDSKSIGGVEEAIALYYKGNR